MYTSKLQPVSLGRVCEDRNRKSTLKVIPIELLPGVSGTVESVQMVLKDQGVDAKGEPYSVQLETANYVEASWLSMSSNRRTAPDVVTDEQVLLWQVGDTEEYYWTSLGRDDSYRTLESVVYAIAATPEKNDDPIDGDNSYFLELSSHDQRILLSTAKKNGEYCRYQFSFDLNKGIVTLHDDRGNQLCLNSRDTQIVLRNADQTHIVLDKKNITFTAAESLSATIGDTVKMVAGKDLTLKAGGSMTLQAAALTIDAPSISVTGNISVGGSARSGYTATFQATTTFQSAVSFQAPVSFGADVTGTNFYGNFHGTLFGGLA